MYKPMIYIRDMLMEVGTRYTGVHNAKAEECTTPRIGSRNIKIIIGWGGLPRNQKIIVTAVAIAAVCQPSSLQAHRSKKCWYSSGMAAGNW